MKNKPEGCDHAVLFFFFSYFFFHPIYCVRPSILSLLVVTQIRGHIAGSSPPLRTTVRALHFLSREDFSSFFPRRLAGVEFCLSGRNKEIELQKIVSKYS